MQSILVCTFPTANEGSNEVGTELAEYHTNMDCINGGNFNDLSGISPHKNPLLLETP